MLLLSMRLILFLSACSFDYGYGLRLALDTALRDRISADRLSSVFRGHMVPQPQQALKSILLALDPRSAFSPLSAFDPRSAFTSGFDSRSRSGRIWTSGEPLASLQGNAGKILLPKQESSLPLIHGLRGPSPKMMPKVYSVPQITAEEWAEKHVKLHENRILHLNQELDDWIVNLLISQMLYMDAEDCTKPIHLYINSPGGSVIAGLALYDTMQHIKSPVYTCNLGMAASMASFLLAAGVRGKRIGLPHSRVMIHQPAGGGTQAEDPRVEAEQILKIKETVITMYSDMTGQPREKIEQDLSFDNYMSAQQALQYGLIDYIPIPPDET